MYVSNDGSLLGATTITTSVHGVSLSIDDYKGTLYVRVCLHPPLQIAIRQSAGLYVEVSKVH